jgi:hypothetical protein
MWWMNLIKAGRSQGSGASARGIIPATFFHLPVKDREEDCNIHAAQTENSHNYRVKHVFTCLLSLNKGAVKLEIESLQAMQPVCTK